MQINITNVKQNNLVYLLITNFFLFSSYCSGSKEHVSSSADMISYAKSAEELYEKGMKKLNTNNCGEAVKIFSQIKEKYPYSRYSQLAELRIADCDFITEDYAQSTEKYKEFAMRYPSHSEVGYAMFKRAMSTFKRIPSKIFILPPVYERDQINAKEAAREFKEFLDQYPDSPYQSEARKHYIECLNLLAMHELYVAKYYFKSGKYKGTLNRCNRVITRYNESDFVPEAIILQARCYLKMKQKDKAIATFEFLIKKYPFSYQASHARRYLNLLIKDNK